ncbi:hypothetical protein [Bathymodiolus platifrons methanotrophic gill symbiont]|uniref:hypothetical protein n=1 Tax=Bathymodiolus platifrons methanotrophic gill symbiont TaxID=113268 RepID=UPI001C8E5AFF|nr:hypothetical protein [Bathymodiolus platifrons methanotrophic gill symbiont]
MLQPPCVRHRLSTKQLSHGYLKWLYGSTAIRDKILASLARYRALRIGKFPCAFWRLSSRPGLTANESITRLRFCHFASNSWATSDMIITTLPHKFTKDSSRST